MVELSPRSRLKVAVKRRFAGVSWQNPAFRALLPAVDALDLGLRRRQGLEHLPAYSIRIRGTGLSKEFGGTKFLRTGTELSNSLVRYAGVDASSAVLEIGSGAGRIAYSLASVLDGGGYTGLDVDQVSVDACRASSTLTTADFRFVHVDLQTDLYNRDGGGPAASAYRLPFDDGTFDVVYLESVFTHLTADECANYAGEALRVLRPGGRVVVSGFLREAGTGNSAFTFAHPDGDVWVEYADNPRKAVAADTATFEKWFGRPFTTRLQGGWRGDQGDFPNQQDWLIFTK